jgi:fructose-1,6-bisphosphatase II
VAERKEIDVRDVMVVVLDRPRHDDGHPAIREAGARVRLISDGDVSAAMLAASRDTPVDLLWGIGGTPEGVIAAAALKCIGGGPRRAAVAARRGRARAARRRATTSSASSPRTTSSAGDDCFFSATGVTDGDVLQGVATPAAAAPPRSRSSRARGRHGPPHHRPPQPRQAAALHGPKYG